MLGIFPAPKAAAGDGSRRSRTHATNSMEPKLGVGNVIVKRGKRGVI